MALLSRRFSFGGALSGGWELFFELLSPIAVTSALCSIPFGLSQWALRESGAYTIVSWLLILTLGLFQSLAALALMTARAEGHEPRVRLALTEALRAWPRVFGLKLEAVLNIFVWSLALVVPGIIKYVRLSLVTPIAFLFDSPDSLDRSETLVVGHSWPMMGVLVVSDFVSILLEGQFGDVLISVIGMSPELGLAALIHIGTAYVWLLLSSWRTAVTLCAYYGLQFAFFENTKKLEMREL